MEKLRRRRKDELEKYDLVMVSDVPAHLMGAGQMAALDTYVKGMGGGLVMAGGEDSFGSGGYERTMIESMMPVRFDSTKEKEQPDIALKFIEILCARIRHTSEQVEDVMYLSFPGRLAKTLLQLTGGPEAPAAHRNVRITQRELSSIIGMSRESTNKQLRIWEKRSWIRLERGGIVVIAPDVLATIASEVGEE